MRSGSIAAEKTMGMVWVAALAANAAGGPPAVKSTATLRRVQQKPRQSIIVAFRPPKGDQYILALHKTEVPKPLLKTRNDARRFPRRSTTKKSDYRHCRLLRARREWPRCCRGGAEKGNELAPPHLPPAA
jgi:hypothetical protein